MLVHTEMIRNAIHVDESPNIPGDNRYGNHIAIVKSRAYVLEFVEGVVGMHNSISI